jgi:hypothetical protein
MVRAWEIALDRFEDGQHVALHGGDDAGDLWRAADEVLRSWEAELFGGGRPDVAYLVRLEDGDSLQGVVVLGQGGGGLLEHVRGVLRKLVARGHGRYRSLLARLEG